MIIALIALGYLGVVFVLMSLVIGGNRKQMPVPTRRKDLYQQMLDELEREKECK